MNSSSFKHNWKYIPIHSISIWKSVFGVAFFLIFIVKLEILYAIIGLSAYYLILHPLFCFISWKQITFTLEEESLHVISGIFVKKKQTIPLGTITNVDMESKLIHQLFSLYEVKIENGSQANDENNVSILLDLDSAQLLKDRLQKNNIVEKEKIEYEVNSYKATFLDLLFFGTTKSSIVSLIGLFTSFFFFADDVMEVFSVNSSIVYENVWSTIQVSPFVIVLMIILILIMAKIITCVSQLIKYYSFETIKKDEFIEIRYGLITKKHFVIPVDKIFAIRKRQTLLFQLLGKESIELAAVGYGSEENVKALLFPFASKEKGEQMIRELLPEFTFSDEVTRVESAQRGRFYLVPLLVWFILLVVVGIFYAKLSILLLVVLPIIIVHCYFQSVNTGIGYTERLVYSETGGMYCTKTISKKNGIQMISLLETPFQKNSGICNYHISPRNGEVIKVKHIKKTFEKENMI